MAEDKTLIVKRGEGTPLWMFGSLFEIKARADETGGAFTVMEMTIAPAPGPPPHRHNGAEVVYVLEGSLRFVVENKSFDAGAGSLLYFPKGTLEHFENTTDKSARVLVFYIPGGMDKFFQEAAEPAKTRSLPPPSSAPPDIARLTQIAKKYGLELVAP